MEKQNRISLNKRLKMVSRNSPVALAIFEIYTDDYLFTTARMFGLTGIEGRYVDQVGEQLRKGKVLAQTIHDISKMTQKEKYELLYGILIEPIARIKNSEEGEDDDEY